MLPCPSLAQGRGKDGLADNNTGHEGVVARTSLDSACKFFIVEAGEST